jgi:hypothetical protein
MFVTAVRETRHDRGRWPCKPGLGPIDRGTVSRAWHKEALRDAGLRVIPLHALRHTASAAWLSTGRPLMYVQRQLGHAQITTTERLYGHLEESSARKCRRRYRAADPRGRPAARRAGCSRLPRCRGMSLSTEPLLRPAEVARALGVSLLAIRRGEVGSHPNRANRPTGRSGAIRPR